MSHTQRNSNFWIPGLLVFIALFRIPVPDNQMRSLFQLLIEMAVISGVGYYIYNNINKWIGLFLFLTLFSSIYPHFDRITYMARNTVLFSCLWIILIQDNRIKVNHLLNAMCIIALANSVFTILQWAGIDPFSVFSFGFIKYHYRDVICYPGLMANPNELSCILAITTPAFLRNNWYKSYIVVIIGLILAKSTGGVIAICGGLLFYSLSQLRGMRLKHVYPSLSS
jgi:hypothetical protein